MARAKSLSKIKFLSELYQIFGLESECELEKYKSKLFPIGKTTDENQTTSIFLSTLSAVKEFREDILFQIDVKKIKNRNITLHTYIEIPSVSMEDRPDGLIVLTSGVHNPVIEWVALIESKIGNNDIDGEQIERYIKLAKELDIENIITISNQLVSTPFETPLCNIRKSKVNLFHWSWIYLKVTAGRLLKSGIDDEDHIYILSEFRRYVNKHNGIKNYMGMEKSWKETTESFMDKSNKPLIEEIIKSYKQEEKDICLQLTETTGHYVKLKITNKTRDDLMSESLDKNKIVCTPFYLDDDTNIVFELETDFVKRKITCITKHKNNNGKAKAQTTKLLNCFIPDITSEDEIVIGAIYPRRSSAKSDFATLSQLLNDKEEGIYSILNKNYGDTVKEFEIRMSDDLGKDFHRPQVIVTRLENLVKIFLEKVVLIINK
jgi:hypothetical protein